MVVASMDAVVDDDEPASDATREIFNFNGTKIVMEAFCNGS
ncbi:hypothetical protein A2U01_0007033 [Trifolium medium]|uniref:Uncharacterized protein n=1 Tax=Trifolium medium TaxID=97028 RepID=A0A392MGK5_9FABA|nr:hypothetical protein [Trifolium medium]